MVYEYNYDHLDKVYETPFVKSLQVKSTDQLIENLGTYLEETLEEPKKLSLNEAETTYVEATKNSIELAAGYTLSDGSLTDQTFIKVEPEQFSVRHDTGNALLINKTTGTTLYTDVQFSNNNYVHEYATGNVTLNEGSVTLNGDNVAVNLTGNSSGINITSGHVKSLSGSIILEDGNLYLKNTTALLSMSGVNSFANIRQLSASSLSSTNVFRSGVITNRPQDLGSFSIAQNQTINVPCNVSNYFYITYTGTSGVTSYTKTFNFQNVPTNCYEVQLEIICSDDTYLQWPGGTLWKDNSSFNVTAAAQRTYLVTLRTRNGGSTWLASYSTFY